MYGIFNIQYTITIAMFCVYLYSCIISATKKYAIIAYNTKS